jgi:hypothetical protein
VTDRIAKQQLIADDQRQRPVESDPRMFGIEDAPPSRHGRRSDMHGDLRGRLVERGTSDAAHVDGCGHEPGVRCDQCLAATDVLCGHIAQVHCGPVHRVEDVGRRIPRFQAADDDVVRLLSLADQHEPITFSQRACDEGAGDHLACPRDVERAIDPQPEPAAGVGRGRFGEDVVEDLLEVVQSGALHGRHGDRRRVAQTGVRELAVSTLNGRRHEIGRAVGLGHHDQPVADAERCDGIAMVAGLR